MTTRPRLELLEDYAFGRLAGTDLVSVEEHLLACGPRQSCGVRDDESREVIARAYSLVARIRRGIGRKVGPLKFVHQTSDGPIFSEVKRLGKGKWFARHSGRHLDGGDTTTTLWEANVYLLRTFVQMFPEHRCTRRCGMIRKRCSIVS